MYARLPRYAAGHVKEDHRIVNLGSVALLRYFVGVDI